MENWAAGGISYALITAVVRLITGWWDRRAAGEQTEVDEKDATSTALEVTSKALEMSVNSVIVLQGQMTAQDEINDDLRGEFELHKLECKRAIDLMATELQKLRNEKAKSDARVKSLEDESQVLRAQIEQLQDQSAQKDTKIEDLQLQINLLKTELAASEDARKEAEQERDSLRERIEQLNGKPSTLSTIKASEVTGAMSNQTKTDTQEKP